MNASRTYLPIAFRLDNRHLLIIGGGEVAENKLRLVLGRCAGIYLWAAQISAGIRALCAVENERPEGEARQVVWLREENVTAEALVSFYAESGRRLGLVFAATDDKALNHLVCHWAEEHHVPVCAVDDPEQSSFITPALVDRSPVQVAVSTSGASPVLARRLREKIEALLPEGLGEAAHFMAQQRAWLAAELPSMTARKRLWEAFMDGSGYEAALVGEWQKARDILHHLVHLSGQRQQGEVWLVGAGPGNPDLLTLLALRLMQNADSVLYDNLVSEEILARLRRDAERICVGKKKGHHLLAQEDIEAELIRRAEAGQRVLRLKGGDPFVFGRGGEEMEAVLRAGLTVRVVPGITAANGCGAAVGIPLTHRDCAQSCLFVTGHKKGDGTLTLDWPSLVQKGQTVVVYMGVASLPQLCAGLSTHGLPKDWPVAVVENGTRQNQQVVIGNLADIVGKIQGQNITGPALIFVGEVVRYYVQPGQ